MNLNYDPTTSALRELVATADPKLNIHYVALDFDGEVIIDPELKYPQADIRKYKFCKQIQAGTLRNVRKLQALHADLMESFKDYMHTISRNDYLGMAA